MANNIVYFDTTNNSIQQFSANDVAKIADYILEYMAANGTFTGSITVGTSNPLGTFTDTTLGGYPFPAANSDNVTIYSTTYTLSQINTATLTAQSDPPKYVGLDITDPNTVILQEDKTTLEDLADEIIGRMIGDYGVNSYYLGTAAPSDGGLWTNLGSLVDTIDPSNPNTTYFLWKKLNSGTYTNDFKRPLKLSSGELLQFSNTEIQQIVKTVEQRIVATGKGLYSLSSSAPPTGTWTAVGSSVDVRRTTQEINFDGPIFTSAAFENFTGPTYTGNFISPMYEGQLDYGFAGLVEVPYTREYITTTNFIGIQPAIYSGQYVGPATFAWLQNAFLTSFVNPNATSFTGVDVTSFSSINSTFYLGDNAVSFTNVNATFFINANATSFTNVNATPFTNVNAISYVGPAGTYSGPATYLGPSPAYLGPATYFGPGPAYLGPATFLGPGPNYLGPGTYLGPASYLSAGQYVGFQNFTGYWTGIAPANFFGFSSFSSDYLRAEYVIYLGLRPALFATSSAADFTGTYTGTYLADYSTSYTGTRVDTTTTTISTVYLWRRIA